MKTPVLIVICASAAVLCTLPAIYLFLAYHTYKERKGWRVDYDKAVKRLEAEQQRNPRPKSTYSSAERGRASMRAPARPVSAYNPRAAPPRPQTLRRKGPLGPATPGSRLTASTSLSSSSGRRRSSSSDRQRQRRREEEQRLRWEEGEQRRREREEQRQQSNAISLQLLNLQTNLLSQQ